MPLILRFYVKTQWEIIKELFTLWLWRNEITGKTFPQCKPNRHIIIPLVSIYATSKYTCLLIRRFKRLFTYVSHRKIRFQWYLPLFLRYKIITNVHVTSMAPEHCSAALLSSFHVKNFRNEGRDFLNCYLHVEMQEMRN